MASYVHTESSFKHKKTKPAMQKIISFLSIILFIGLNSLSAQCCSGSSSDVKNNSADCKEIKTSPKVKAFYFHASRRCATCQAVEDVAREAIKEYYGNKVSFQSINRDENKSHPMIKKYNISGQTLLIIKDDKHFDLTNYAFMNARTRPEKLKSKIRETIDPIL
jgi:hypothetical protein